MIVDGNLLSKIKKKVPELMYHAKFKYVLNEDLFELDKKLKEKGYYLQMLNKDFYIYQMTEKERKTWEVLNR